MGAPSLTRSKAAGNPSHCATPARADAADDERRLAEGLSTGRLESVTEFLERTHHPLFCMACRLTTDPDLRRDWAHAVLLEILEDLRTGRFIYRCPGSLWGWFRKRAYYRLLDEYRRHRTRLAREGQADPGDPSCEFARAAGIDDPGAEMERLETFEAIETCLAALDNQDHRRALSLRLLEDMSYEEIAESMGAPLNTVRAWIRRGRLSLRGCLAKRLERVGEKV